MSEREGIWFRFGSGVKRTPGWAQGSATSSHAHDIRMAEQCLPESQRSRDVREAKAAHDWLRDHGMHAQADAVARLIRLVESPTPPESER